MTLLELGYPTLDRTDDFSSVLAVGSGNCLSSLQVLSLLNSALDKSDGRFQSLNTSTAGRQKFDGRAFYAIPLDPGSPTFTQTL